MVATNMQWFRASLELWEFWAIASYGMSILASAGIVLASIILINTMFGKFLLLIVVITNLIPLGEAPQYAKDFIEFATYRAHKYFPFDLKHEGVYKLDKSYVFGLEPHSVQPVCIPILFAEFSPYLPRLNKPVRTGISRMILYAPFARHLFYWSGMRNASRQSLERYLKDGYSVAICPGGVREVLYMEPGKEVMFLSKRLGFIKLAMKAGADVVPVACLGQTPAYKYWRPGPPFISTKTLHKVSRILGFVPMLYWGRFYVGAPFRVPMKAVFGAPIEVEQNDAPSDEEAKVYLDKYIESMRTMYNKYKKDVGQEHIELIIM